AGEILRIAGRCHPPHPVEIGAGGKRRAAPRQHDDARFGIGVERLEHAGQRPDDGIVDGVAHLRPADIRVSYGERECILYALGIGIGMDPLDPGELKFVYERAGLEAFPTMAVVLGWPGRMTDPAFGVDDRLVVAGDIKVVLHRPLAVEGKLLSRPRIKEVIDKGAGNAAIIQNTRDLIAEDGTVVATVDSSTFARKHGGFGGKVTETPVPPAVPQTAPGQVCDLPTPPNLALLYRLNGDENPLHADPARAKVAGFDRPILHGAASFGVAAHAILRTCAD